MEEEVKEIVDHLVQTTSFAAAGIVGMMGSGKTALAQKVFMDERVMDKFALRLWVCVSPDHCKPEEVLMGMLDNLGLDLDEIKNTLKDHCGPESPDKLEKVGVLLFILYMVLLDKSYLIVFDDVRCDDGWYRNLSLPAPTDQEWTERLAFGLPKDDLGGGSAVVATCRSEDVARAMVGSVGIVHRMKPLQDDLLEVGWKVFKNAFDEEAGGEEKMDKDWVEMKQLIVDKCNGLPHALKVAGRELAKTEAIPIPTDAGDKGRNFGHRSSAVMSRMSTGENRESHTALKFVGGLEVVAAADGATSTRRTLGSLGCCPGGGPSNAQVSRSTKRQQSKRRGVERVVDYINVCARIFA